MAETKDTFKSYWILHKGKMRMRIAVYDDCMEDALHLKCFLGGNEVKVYSDAECLLADIENKGILYDLYLLDIFMEKSMNGIELAERLRKVHEGATICFVSASNDFYREAYDLYAVQYLLKPVQEAEVKRLLDKVADNLTGNRQKRLIFHFRGRSKSIPYGKILYMSSNDHMLSICCIDGETREYKGKLSELALQVCGDTFMRCHQSFIVNMYHVEGLNITNLQVAGQQIPVSRRYYAEVKKRYQEILFEEMY